MAKKLGLILCSTPDVKNGRKIAQKLLDEKLAACVSIISKMESHYVWKGKREQTKEVLLLIKAPKNSFKIIEKTIRTLHPYECPEILQIGVEQSFKEYLNWVFEETNQR
ncbi:MAG: divalent-cation tolerance protein CutA [Verrucomicrobiota bacterium]